MKNITLYTNMLILTLSFIAPQAYAQNQAVNKNTSAETMRKAPGKPKKLPVGRIIISAGQLEAINKSGKRRRLQRASKIYEGDTIRTRNGSHTQIRLRDGALLALRPNTQFQVNTYRFKGKQDGTERSVFSLLKGGFRTITGLIGKQNKQNYRVKTPVATVGIRGTHYGLRLCNDGSCGGSNSSGLYGGVVDGSIAITNKAGERTFNNDQYFHVTDKNSLPKGLLQPPGVIFDGTELTQQEREKDKEQQDKQQTASNEPAEQENNNDPNKEQNKQEQAKQEAAKSKAPGGNPFADSIAQNAISQKPGIDNPVLVSGETQTENNVFGGIGQAAPAGSVAVFSFIGVEEQLAVSPGPELHGSAPAIISDGTFDQFILLGEEGVVENIPIFMRTVREGKDNQFLPGNASLADVGGDSNLGVIWGRWVGGSELLENGQQLGHVPQFHFMFSPNITSSNVLNNLGTLGSTVSFSPIAHTDPTDHNGIVGTLAGASMTVDFLGKMVTAYNVQTNYAYNGTSYTATLAAATSFSDLLNDNGLQLTGMCSGGPCMTSIGIDGQASVAFVDKGNEKARGAITSFGLSTANQAVDPKVGSSGTILFVRP